MIDIYSLAKNPLVFQKQRTITSAYIDVSGKMGIAQTVLMVQDNFTENFGAIKQESPNSESAQALVRRLQEFITQHCYTCTNEILAGLGQMYAAGGEMTDNIDKAGGKGTAAFVSEAIRIICTR